MEITEIFNKLKSTFGDSVFEMKYEPPSDGFITVAPDKIVDISLELRDNPEYLFDYLSCLSGMDNGDQLGVVYHLYSFKHKHNLVLKLSVPKETPDVPTVERVWRTADWHEREAYDLIGINFVGHHNLIRILCPYDWEGHPLQKSYVTPEYYHNLPVPY